MKLKLLFRLSLIVINTFFTNLEKKLKLNTNKEKTLTSVQLRSCNTLHQYRIIFRKSTFLGEGVFYGPLMCIKV